MVATTFLTSLFSCRIFASGMLAVFADGLSLVIVGITALGDMPIRKWSAMKMSTHGWRVAQRCNITCIFLTSVVCVQAVSSSQSAKHLLGV
jgi:hypothetical protein